MNKDSLIHMIKQMFKYGIVGVINTLITLLSMGLLHYVLKTDYNLSNFIGYILGFLNSFLMNKLWTFKSKGDVKKETLIFIGVFGVTYLIQLGLVHLLMTGLGIPKTIATLTGMVVYTLIGFFGNKFVTFGTKTKKDF